jgi:hypothetical protein
VAPSDRTPAVGASPVRLIRPVAYQDEIGALWIVDQYGTGRPGRVDLPAGTSPSLSGPLLT